MLTKYREFTLPEAISEAAAAMRGRTLAQLFDLDPRRAERLSRAWEGWLVDFSKERITGQGLDALLDHAASVNLASWIAALFAGEKVNLSEARPALHTALRQAEATPVFVAGEDVIPMIGSIQARMRALSSSLRNGERKGALGAPILHVVNIGIGGSDLGPRMVCDALASTAPSFDVAFVSNVDPAHLARALGTRLPAETLFIVTSKTFMTQETIANARSARGWLATALGGDRNVGSHFIGVTANVEAAIAFGIAPDDILPLWDWVGGRYSLWSAVGLPIAIAHGFDRFERLLAGAARMDNHFRFTPFPQNLPVLLALVTFWNTRVLGHGQRVIVPYAQALSGLPAYLQQLSLESNGKRVTRDGSAVAGPTAPGLWGATGTEGQHAFFQWLHQGTSEVPVEFIVPVRGTHPPHEQQVLLVANALAQAQALLQGLSEPVLSHRLAELGLSGAPLHAAVAARACPGDRASTTLLLPTLNAYELGSLLALYEHRTFVEGVLFGINSFDQWGVELGKTLTPLLIAALGASSADFPQDIDPSTRALTAHARSLLAS
ncbi:MAG: glucose-6-phosphate isomerase [Casimicrobiaceae bacterium]